MTTQLTYNKPGPKPFRQHGSEARARRHYRDREIPLKKWCPACAEAHRMARIIREGRMP